MDVLITVLLMWDIMTTPNYKMKYLIVVLQFQRATPGHHGKHHGDRHAHMYRAVAESSQTILQTTNTNRERQRMRERDRDRDRDRVTETDRGRDRERERMRREKDWERESLLFFFCLFVFCFFCFFFDSSKNSDKYPLIKIQILNLS